MRAVIIVAAVIFTFPALAAGTINYGTRAGMVVDVVSMSGLDSGRALIRTKHSRANATAFCRDYVGKVTAGCIEEELNTRLNDQVKADCTKGEFTDFVGARYRFAGPSKVKNEIAEFRIVDLRTGEDLDGSMASNYPVSLDIFKALCPSHFYQADSVKR